MWRRKIKSKKKKRKELKKLGYEVIGRNNKNIKN